MSGPISLTLWIGGQKTPFHITICYMTEDADAARRIAVAYAKEKKVFGSRNDWFITFDSSWGSNSCFVSGVNKDGISLAEHVNEIFKRINMSHSNSISKKRYITGQPPMHIAFQPGIVHPVGQIWTCSLSI